jgi:hypothetical protein
MELKTLHRERGNAPCLAVSGPSPSKGASWTTSGGPPQWRWTRAPRAHRPTLEGPRSAVQDRRLQPIAEAVPSRTADVGGRGRSVGRGWNAVIQPDVPAGIEYVDVDLRAGLIGSRIVRPRHQADHGHVANVIDVGVVAGTGYAARQDRKCEDRKYRAQITAAVAP